MKDPRNKGGMDLFYERLKAIDLENEELVMEANSIAKVVNRGKNCLVLKLLTTKYYNREASKATVRKVRHPVKSLHFHEMGEGLLMAEFEL